ncbi:MAG: Gfo/Idh/MocA family oxidoreductase [Lachnospiraceae bacterium]|nr:Gfo/Idh/MocA family oxidoreductase [Lachnospiraceae bacterium]
MYNKNIALIGAGRAGMIHARNFINKVPGLVLTAISDPSEEAAIKACNELGVAKCYQDYRQVLDDDTISAVIIVSPTKFHCEIAVEAAKAGKHILCEKPMAINEDECRRMINAAKENNVFLQIGFMRRFDSGFVAAKQALDDGVIGDVVLVKSLTRGPSTPKEWMYDISKSNGPLAEVNSHDIDTLHWFTGSEFEHIYAIAGNYRCPDAKEKYPDFYDNVILSGLFKNGMQGVIDGAQGVGYGYDARVEILGSDGVIYIGNTNENGMTYANRSGLKNRMFIKSWTGLFTQAYLAEDRAFAESVLEGKPPLVTGEDGLNAVRVVNAGNQSIKEKRIVRLT